MDDIGILVIYDGDVDSASTSVSMNSQPSFVDVHIRTELERRHGKGCIQFISHEELPSFGKNGDTAGEQDGDESIPKDPSSYILIANAGQTITECAFKVAGILVISQGAGQRVHPLGQKNFTPALFCDAINETPKEIVDVVDVLLERAKGGTYDVRISSPRIGQV